MPFHGGGDVSFYYYVCVFIHTTKPSSFRLHFAVSHFILHSLVIVSICSCVIKR